MYLQIYSPPPRHPRQTAANYAFTLRCSRRSAALALLLHVTRYTWRALAFIYRLRRPARLRAAIRATSALRIASPPSAMIGYDVGYGNDDNDLVIRTPTGHFISHHPSSPSLSILAVPAYSPNGDTVPSLVPPAVSRLVLCPERSGAWCYRHLDHGTTLWHLPSEIMSRSSPISPLSLPKLAALDLEAPPPELDDRITLDTLDRLTPWMPLYRDHDHVITLYNKATGASRFAPWLTLRHHGRVYFANILSRETRWAPPLQWMCDWLSRQSPFDRRSPHARMLLPPSLARMNVDGGAPYLDSIGTPHYDSDSNDSSSSYPM